MSFKVSLFKGAPQMDSLPVAKTLLYPLEERDYRPYAQSRICIGEDGSLTVQMWAFELIPPQGSCVQGVFYLFPQQSPLALSLTAFSTEEYTLQVYEDGVFSPLAQRSSGKVSVHPFGGEDLQGVYWGSTFTIEPQVVQDLYGQAPTAGHLFSGNFYKLSPDSAHPHAGSFYPADFAGNPYALSSMGAFEVVAY